MLQVKRSGLVGGNLVVGSLFLSRPQATMP